MFMIFAQLISVTSHRPRFRACELQVVRERTVLLLLSSAEALPSGGRLVYVLLLLLLLLASISIRWLALLTWWQEEKYRVSAVRPSSQLPALDLDLIPCCRRHRPCHRRCAAARTCSSGILQSSPQGPDCLELATGAQGKASSAVSCTKYRGVSHMDGPARPSSPVQTGGLVEANPLQCWTPPARPSGTPECGGPCLEGWTMPVDAASK